MRSSQVIPWTEKLSEIYTTHDEHIPLYSRGLYRDSYRISNTQPT